MHGITRRRVLQTGLALPSLSAVGGAVLAQNTQPIRILVGFPAGGSVDFVARLAADRIKSLGPVLVENRPGASGRLATQIAKEAAPDGMTLLASPGAVFTLFPHMFRVLRYDPFKDLVPVAKLVAWDLALAVPAASPIKTFAEFVEAAKRDPKQAFFASASAGSPLHFLGLELGKKIGVSLEHVSFKGGREAVTALAGNQVPSALLNLGDLMELQRGGRVRILTIFSETRSPVLPDVPTIKELGHPDMVSDGWVALYAPAATPEPVLRRLQVAVNDAMAQPDMKDRITAAGGRAHADSRQQLDELTRAEFARWKEVVQKSGYQED